VLNKRCGGPVLVARPGIPDVTRRQALAVALLALGQMRDTGEDGANWREAGQVLRAWLREMRHNAPGGP